MKSDREAKAAEYVMGLMETNEREAFEIELSNDPALQSQVAHWREEFASLDEEYDEVPVKWDLWDAIDGQISSSDQPAEQKAANDNVNAASLLKWKITSIASSAVAACLVLFLILQSGQNQGDMTNNASQPILVAQLQGDIDGLLLTASYSPNDGAMKIDVDGMPETETEPEIWVQKPDMTTVSLGQIGRDGISAMTVPEGFRQYISDGAQLVLTMEPPSTTPHKRPTGEAVATGRVKLIA